MNINQFIASFPGILTHEECRMLIDHYERLSTLNLSFTRLDLRDAPRHKKSDTATFPLEEPALRITASTSLLNFFLDRFWACYAEYSEKYSILKEASNHQIRAMKIQKTLPGEGYHVWHFESDNLERSSRIISWAVYLNTIESGGETEFLYQGVRVPAVEGTLVIWPAGFTHTHRGNPPLSGEKYLLTGWAEF